MYYQVATCLNGLKILNKTLETRLTGIIQSDARNLGNSLILKVLVYIDKKIYKKEKGKKVLVDTINE